MINIIVMDFNKWNEWDGLSTEGNEWDVLWNEITEVDNVRFEVKWLCHVL